MNIGNQEELFMQLLLESLILTSSKEIFDTASKLSTIIKSNKQCAVSSTELSQNCFFLL
jgi:hypothetical protein